MGPRALAASSGLAPWNIAVDGDTHVKNFHREWGVTFINSTERF